MDVLNQIPSTVIVAVISFLSALLGVVIFYNVKKDSIMASTKKTTAEAENITVQSAMTLIKEMQTALKSQQKKIEEMEIKIQNLEEHEIQYNQERAQLKENIRLLKEENAQLIVRSKKDKKQIIHLNNELDKLNEKLSA